MTIKRKPGKRGLIRLLPTVLALACLLAALTRDGKRRLVAIAFSGI